MTREGLRTVSVLSCILALGLAACGFGTARGAPYDFAQLDSVIRPILGSPSLTLVERLEFGTDCHGQGCERPLLVYTFRSGPPATCQFVRSLTSMFDGVSKPFEPAAPQKCSYAGEVHGHAVVVVGTLTRADDILLDSGDGVAAEIRISIAAARLAA